MVELLVKRQANYINPDPGKHKRSVYERGDIVVAMPDGWGWGKEEHPMTSTESPTPFFIVKIPGVTVKEAQKYLQPEVDDTNPTIVLSRRLWRINIDDVPSGIKKTILDTGEVTLEFAQIKNFIHNKQTGINER